MKYRPSILRTIPEELKEDIKQKTKGFVEEMTMENPDWVADRRVEYLNNKIMELYRKIAYWLKYTTTIDWWNEAIMESLINPMWKKIEKMEKEICLYQNPIVIDYDKKITNDEIEYARNIDCADILEIKRRSSGRNWALCPFHQDTNPSLLCYPAGKGYYCFVCNAHGDAIDLVRKTMNYSFKEAIEYLRRF